MKRFDRAVYAFFLLALLADVARANVPAPVGGDSAGGLILRAAGQLRAGPAGAAVSVRRRSSGGFAPIARSRSTGARLTFSRWAKIFSGQASPLDQSTQVMLVAVAYGPGVGAGVSFDRPFLSDSSSLAIFEHAGSPAP